MKYAVLTLSFLCCALFVWAQKKVKHMDTPDKQTIAAAATQIDYKQPGAPMPAIRLITPILGSQAEFRRKMGKDAELETKVITDKDLNNDANLLVMMFNPTCGHCEEQADLFAQHISMFQKSKLVFMAGAQMLPYLEFFNSKTHAATYPQTIIMGVDSAQFIDKTFLYDFLPQINIYDHKRHLIRSFTGVTTIDSLQNYIE